VLFIRSRNPLTRQLISAGHNLVENKSFSQRKITKLNKIFIILNIELHNNFLETILYAKAEEFVSLSKPHIKIKELSIKCVEEISFS
jgi:hypothetical protein